MKVWWMDLHSNSLLFIEFKVKNLNIEIAQASFMSTIW